MLSYRRRLSDLQLQPRQLLLRWVVESGIGCMRWRPCRILMLRTLDQLASMVLEVSAVSWERLLVSVVFLRLAAAVEEMGVLIVAPKVEPFLEVGKVLFWRLVSFEKTWWMRCVGAWGIGCLVGCWRFTVFWCFGESEDNLEMWCRTVCSPFWP
jgi:hypothetical protein